MPYNLYQEVYEALLGVVALQTELGLLSVSLPRSSVLMPQGVVLGHRWEATVHIKHV